MESIISLAKNASPIVLSLVCIAGLIHIVILQLEGRGLIKKSSSQSETNTSLNVFEITRLDAIEKQLDKIANNHLHGLPEMERTMTRIEEKVDKFADDVINLRERVARLE